MPQKHTYITTTIPYVNADPHIGFALEIVQADIFGRYRKLIRDEVFFNTGTDEHGSKVYKKTQELGRKDIQAYVDEGAEKFRKLGPLLGLLPDIHFIRTTDAHHIKAAQEFWKLCFAAGDIYKKNYSVKYCVGCELEKTDSELVDSKCPIHPNLDIETIQEENYFFKFSRFQKPLLDLYSSRPDLVVPDFRFNEIKVFVEHGLEDFSISRLKSKMPWGIDVPGDPEQVMYVWFDALVNYISTIGWQGGAIAKNGDFDKWWPVIQFAGKDQIRQQAAMWQAMLMSAGSQTKGLLPSKQIFIHGFITSGGQKMSKSLGNVIDPYTIVSEYGADALRYYLAREIHPFEDSDFTMDKFKAAYNANLANGLGNLVSRILKLTSTYGIVAEYKAPQEIWQALSSQIYRDFLDSYQYNKAADFVWGLISVIDQTIQTTQPFKKLKDPALQKEGTEIMTRLLEDLWYIVVLLEPIMPAAAQTIQSLLKANKMPDKPLFMRKD